VLAKGALRRLAEAKLDPTPENYARAYAAESAAQGVPIKPAERVVAERSQGREGRNDTDTATSSTPDTLAWAALVERLVKQSDRASRQWTSARRRASLSQVFESSRTNPARLQQRLSGLVTSWEGDGSGAASGIETAPPTAAPGDAARTGAPAAAIVEGQRAATASARPWLEMLGSAMPAAEPRAAALAQRLAAPDADEEPAAAALRLDLRRWLQHREELVQQMHSLGQGLARGLVELSEDGSWVQGQALNIQARLADGASVRAVRAAGSLLGETQQAQAAVKRERQAARAALQEMIARMLEEAGTLGDQAGGWQQTLERHADAVQSAPSLQALAGVVQDLLQGSRAMAGQVAASRERLAADRQRALALEAQVQTLEGELRRVSDELQTDALTQVANRRGLQSLFEVESARALRQAPSEPARTGGATRLAIGLIDIDNFKKLNDTLGHAAGDQALKTLAAQVRERLRPADHIARFGGEEFVVLLPDTPATEAQQVLTRLQRALTEALFLHEGREVFVTFSAGVSAWRAGEPMAAALERADEALYEAKRSGKNRTCLG
jgi:diguanylate cyclase